MKSASSTEMIKSTAGETSDFNQVFSLEYAVLDPISAFADYIIPQEIIKNSAIVILDTNILLLPYSLKGEDLSSISTIYEDLAKNDRLYIPSRVAREFLKLRDRKLSEILKHVYDTKSKLNTGLSQISFVIKAADHIEQLNSTARDLDRAKKAYSDALDKIAHQVRSWNGNDPITKLYRSIFDSAKIIDLDESKEKLLEEWKVRQKNKVPPGYKDSTKEDTGIGDFLIWRTILKLAAQRKKDFIFVTSEEKSDWFVRSENESIYPRFELIEEFRRSSGGRNIRFMKLHDLLREMSAPKTIIERVEAAESIADDSINLELYRGLDDRKPLTPDANISHSILAYGGGNVTINDDGRPFKLQFSESSRRSIWLYSTDESPFVTTVNAPTESVIDARLAFNRADGRPCEVKIDHVFLVKNQKNEILAGRLLSTNMPDEDPDPFIVTFIYRTFPPNSFIILP